MPTPKPRKAPHARRSQANSHSFERKQIYMEMIETKGLTKTFKARKGNVEAVRGVNLQVHEGEIFGFLGPNGAGKTTTMRMLATLLDPTSGQATICGRDL